ncbi:MAG: hypothetical protein H8D42_03270 [Candidatus Marinimicrobia bacterium]|nr:hypothetical protein [Candidatus Neomarinimicrobiota bacterium]
MLAERQGFEPWVGGAYNGFRDRPVRRTHPTNHDTNADRRKATTGKTGTGILTAGNRQLATTTA